MSPTPRNSAEVALYLVDHARKMGIPVTLECSLVSHSDSRYVILFPGTVVEAVLRISSHRPFEERYSLCIDVSRPSLLELAIPIGINWMEEHYGDGTLQATAQRGDLPVPEYHSAEAAGMDLRAAEAGQIMPGQTKVISTGFAVAFPVGYEGQVRSRSGLAAKDHVSVLNSPGTIDSDYRGELLVILHNAGAKPFRYERGDRVAQFVIAPVVHAEVSEVVSLPPSGRGIGGLGSTGR